MTIDRRTQCRILNSLIASGLGPYTRHHAKATRECMIEMEKSGYLTPTGCQTPQGDEMYEINISNDYAEKLFRDATADQDRNQTKITEVS